MNPMIDFTTYRNPPPAATGHVQKRNSQAGNTSYRLSRLDQRRTGGVVDDDIGRDIGVNRRKGAAHGAAIQFDPLGRRVRETASIGRRGDREKDKGLPFVDIIIDFVHRRYQPVTRFLNLDNIFQDQMLRTHGIDKWMSPTDGEDKLATTIWKAAAELDPPPLNVSLADNKLTGLQFRTFPRHLRNIVGLSLMNNLIRVVGDLGNMRTGHGLKRLRELILLDNPIRTDAETSADPFALDFYRYNIQSYIRTIRVLDHEAIPNVQFDVPLSDKKRVYAAGLSYPTTFPLPTSPNAVDPHLLPILGAFLMQFFHLHDTHRAQLASMYADNATYSISGSVKTVDRNIALGWKPDDPSVRQGSYNDILAIWPQTMRNLKQLPAAPARLAYLFQGPMAIVEALSKLPPTQHPLSDPTKFSYDATVMDDMGTGQMLLVTVHGEFLEKSSRTMWSFDRSFVLITAPAGHPVQAMNLNVLISSDMLVIRRPTAALAWVPGPIVTQEQAYSVMENPPGSRRPVLAGDTSMQAEPTQTIETSFVQPPMQPTYQQPGQLMPTVPQQPQVVPQAPPVQQPVQQAPAEPSVPDGWAELSEEQRNIVHLMKQHTGMNIGACLLLLKVDNWDTESAWSHYLAVKNEGRLDESYF